MTSIVKRFSKYLTGIEYPKEKTSWNIAGIIKGKNAYYRFDVRNMFEMPNDRDWETFRKSFYYTCHIMLKL